MLPVCEIPFVNPGVPSRLTIDLQDFMDVGQGNQPGYTHYAHTLSQADIVPTSPGKYAPQQNPHSGVRHTDTRYVCFLLLYASMHAGHLT